MYKLALYLRDTVYLLVVLSCNYFAICVHDDISVHLINAQLSLGGCLLCTMKTVSKRRAKGTEKVIFLCKL